MFIKYLLAIMIVGSGAFALAQDRMSMNDAVCNTCPECIYFVQPDGSGGYMIDYNDGTSDDFPDGTPIVVSRAGYYKLCSDVVFDNGDVPEQYAIQIEGSNLVVDLNGFSVITENNAFDSGVISAAAGASDLTIKNGRLIPSTPVITGNALVCQGSNLFIDVQDIKTFGANIGFLVNGGSSLRFNGCIASGCSYGFDFFLASNVSITDCVGIANKTAGFMIGNSENSNFVIQNCLAVGNGGGVGSAGGFVINIASATLLGNLAYNNNNASSLANYSGSGVFGSVIIDNGAQIPPGMPINRAIENIEII